MQNNAKMQSEHGNENHHKIHELPYISKERNKDKKGS
jgi:hypothetical protein